MERSYFIASTSTGLSRAWLDMTSMARPVTSRVYAAILRKDLPVSRGARERRERNGEEGDRRGGGHERCPGRRDYIVDYLKRTPQMANAAREGDDQVEPAGGIYGPKVMVINQMSGSGGEALPWLFRKAQLGRLVGVRT
jgi:hypothetical protein